MNEMILISVDDHLIEPGDMYDNHLAPADLALAPKLKTSASGANYWEYQGLILPVTGLNAVAGRVPEEYGMEPSGLHQMREAAYNPLKRVADMDVNGIAASLNFATAVMFDGSVFQRAPDRDLAVRHMRAYNDWHIDEWCGAAPGRFIPCCLVPTWNMDAAVAEMKRLAAKGCKAISVNENPTKVGLPSIHNSYWEPFWAAAVEYDLAIALHIGSGNAAPHASLETPIEAWMTTMPMSVGIGIADWLNLSALQRHPGLRILVAEGGIGWVPSLLERADYVHTQHKAWTNSDFGGRKPSEVFYQHFMSCFIDDSFGLKNLDNMDDTMVAYECDYPHSDSLWPRAPDVLWERMKDLPRDRIDRVTHQNAMRFLRFDPTAHLPLSDLTVGALRRKAAAAKVDTTPLSFGGVRPISEGERRRVTSGDIENMRTAMAETIRDVEVA